MQSKRAELDPLGGMTPAKQRTRTFQPDFCQDADSPMDWRELGRRVLSEAARLAKEVAGDALQAYPTGQCDATRDGHEEFADLADAAADTASSVSHLNSQTNTELQTNADSQTNAELQPDAEASA